MDSLSLYCLHIVGPKEYYPKRVQLDVGVEIVAFRNFEPNSEYRFCVVDASNDIKFGDAIGRVHTS